jgi:hypothetical protein
MRLTHHAFAAVVYASAIALSTRSTAIGQAASNRKAAGDTTARTAQAASPRYSWHLGTPVVTNDAGQVRVGRPCAAWSNGGSELIVPDCSDQDIKIYQPSGARVRTVGSAGYRDGQFTHLSTAQPYRDSLIAFDIKGNRLQVFDARGSYVRDISLTNLAHPIMARVVDDSLVLVVSSALGDERNPLVAMVRPNGTVRSRMFNRHAYFRGNPELIQNATAVADAADGMVVVGQFGVDSVFLFDYDGRALRSLPIDAKQPLPRLDSLIRRNGGQFVTAGGVYAVDHQRALNNIVALPRHRVALYVMDLDAAKPFDITGGGTVIIQSGDRPGPPEFRSNLPMGLLGRSHDGVPLLVARESQVLRIVPLSR